MKIVATVLAGVSLALAASHALAQARVAVNLITHSSVQIDRPPAVIWPHIVEPNAWKQGLDLRPHAGQPGQIGEVFAAFDPADPGPIGFFAENVELVPNRRRTIKLYDAKGTLLGFGTWTLVVSGGGTMVGYDVYSETLIPPEQAGATSPRARAATEREALESNQKRFDSELAALKMLVEGGR
jgi:hypothetical protein